ncbi:plasmid mobilization protein [Paracoccus sp. T5]
MADDRPSKSGTETRQRSKLLQIRVTPDELAEIVAQADRAQLTPASYARSVLLSAPAPRARRRPSIEAEAMGRLLGELGKVGSNLNQIAHHMNAGRNEVSPAAMEAALSEVADIRAAILEAMGRKP